MSKDDGGAIFKLRNELKVTDQLLKSGEITPEQHAAVSQFLSSQIKSMRADVSLGFNELEKSIQAQYQKEVYKLYGVDASGYKGVFANIATSKSNPKWRYTGIDYAREVTGGWSDYVPDSNTGPAGAVYSTNISVGYETVKDIGESVEQELNWGAILQSFRSVTGPSGVNAASVLWDEYGGIVLCECDDADCDAQIEMSREEYMHASGYGGYYRVTSSGCSHGVLGAYLVERGKGYNVWTKMA